MWSLPIIATLLAQAHGHLIHHSPLEARDGEGFGYYGEIGAINWYHLNKTANRQCAYGKQQSPTILDSSIATVAGSAYTLSVPTQSNGAPIANIGTTIKVDLAAAGGTLQFQGRTFNVLQYHFHTPSEHHLGDKAGAGELHIVTSDRQNASRLAVVGFVIDICAENGCTEPFLASTFANLAQLTTPGSSSRTASLNFAALASRLSQNTVRTYSGSLTTPPCSEVVTWILSTSRIRAQLPGFNAVNDVLGFNARYVQNKLGSRNLLDLADEQMP